MFLYSWSLSEERIAKRVNARVAGLFIILWKLVIASASREGKVFKTNFRKTLFQK
jgi:hypothetical protein